MRKLALLAVVATVAFVGCQKKTEEAAPVDTTAVVPADTAAVVADTTKVDSAAKVAAPADSVKK